MKLVLYSGGERKANKQLNQHLLRLAGKKIDRISFIPSCSSSGRQDFNQFKYLLRGQNIKQFNYFAIDKTKITKRRLNHLLESQAIHLSGGNTFYFLKHLRKSGIIPSLKLFAQRGGILTGLSAGSILITPNIECAKVPKFDADSNDVKLKDLRSMALVNFEVSPHFEFKRKFIKELCSYSKKKKHPVYAYEDGSGIVVDDEKLHFIGNVYAFYRGECSHL